MSNLCENCNNETDNLAFCPHCGLAQVCTECDHPFDRGAKFCGKCGAERKEPAEATKQDPVPEMRKQPTMPSEQPVPQQSMPQPPKQRKIPPVTIGLIIAALVFTAILASNSFTSPEKQIEKTVTKYMQAVEQADYQAVKKLYHPESPYMEDIADFLDLPNDLTVEIHEFYDFDIDDEYAEVTALVSIESFFFGEKLTEDVYVELKKLKNKWYLYDVY
ncbi:MAG TPA: hypothetical protein VK056_03840 [Bacillota bacterium]|nr:hypothetical protein [Bacillota bacterium]